MSWSVVSTTNASAQDIARFAAHHLSIGCEALHIYLDAPSQGIEKLSHPLLHLHPGDTSSAELHKQQMANAARAYRAAKTAWIAHLDIDEFVIATKPIGEQLNDLPQTAEWVSLPPVEPLIAKGGAPHLYKRAPRHIGKPRALLEDIYPAYGLMLRSGFLGYDTGKPIARTGLAKARLGVHKLLRAKPPARIEACLAHHHAPSWPSFKAALPQRLSNGSYSAAYKGFPSIAEIITLLRAEGQEPALKAFYMALRDATPDHVNTLQKHGLLLHHQLQLDEKAKIMFPEVFESETK